MTYQARKVTPATIDSHAVAPSPIARTTATTTSSRPIACRPVCMAQVMVPTAPVGTMTPAVPLDGRVLPEADGIGAFMTQLFPIARGHA